ncbi:hypothetical protein [Paralcaligenes ginsengisoli]
MLTEKKRPRIDRDLVFIYSALAAAAGLVVFVFAYLIAVSV